MQTLDDLVSQIASVKGSAVVFALEDVYKKGTIQSIQIVIAEKNYVYLNVEDETTKEVYQLRSEKVFEDKAKDKEDLSLVIDGRITTLRDAKEKIDTEVSSEAGG